MYTRIILIAAAVLINCAIIAAFLGWNAHATAEAQSRASNAHIITLAPVTVYPSAAELQALQRARHG